MKYLLDTDHISFLQRRSSSEFTHLKARMEQHYKLLGSAIAFILALHVTYSKYFRVVINSSGITQKVST